MADHILGDRALRRLVPEQAQLGEDLRSAPRRVLLGHPPDELADVSLRRRPSKTPRLAAPVEPEALAMPPDDCVGLDDQQDRSPILPEPRQPNPEDAVSILDLRPFHTALLDGQLLTESKIFKNDVLFALKYEP